MYKRQDQTTIISAGDFIEGRTYKTKTTGTTDFTLIGASEDNINIVFTATGAGTGNGTAYQIEKVIKNERVDFYISENANEERYENLISSIKINENKLKKVEIHVGLCRCSGYLCLPFPLCR